GQTGFVPPKKKPVKPVVYSKAPSLFTAERAGAWLLLAGISAAMPFALYLFYIVYVFLMTSLAHALPGVYKVVSFLFDNLGETTMCGLLATGVFLLFADDLFLKAERICPARLGLRYLVLGLLMLGATLAAAIYFVNHQTENDEQHLYLIMLTLYAMLLDGVFLLKCFHHYGNPRLLFWKKRVTVFAYQPADKATFYAKITGGPGRSYHPWRRCRPGESCGNDKADAQCRSGRCGCAGAVSVLLHGGERKLHLLRLYQGGEGGPSDRVFPDGTV
ncbi:MAG: hypothetical protein J6P32_05340, partial [Stomatobaculum sp.]|nr:hypothetical protein [Stomatobaculum sp.]